MAQTDFTPGPWEADGNCVRNSGEQHRFTCGLTRTAWASQEEMRANANLIAAAPDLYRVLANAVAQYDAIKGGPIIGALEAARAVLARARGEVTP